MPSHGHPLFKVSLTDTAHRVLQIGQLLASITGEKPTTPTSSSQLSRTSNGIPVKRKADEDSKASNLKAPRIGSTPNSATHSTSDASKAPRPYTGSARPSSTNTSRPLNDRPLSSAPRKPSPFTDGRPSPTSASFSNTSRPGTPASASSLAKRPAPPAAHQSATSDPAKAPKKGSIAEIRARAAAQQNKLQVIGKLQHKSTEKQLTKKEREEAAAEEAKAAKKGLKSSNRSGAGALPSRSGLNGIQRNGNGNGHIDRARGAIQKPATGKSGKAPVVEERKVKKAALATTGYQGSARPVVPKAKSSSVRPGAPGAGRDRGRDKPNPMGMFSKPRRQRDDDYDEDMDDFVVDDEEEEEEGPGYGSRYKYADEDSESDMEAGYSDLDAEEAAAAKAARLEDIREERLLEQRKREKEARKRALLQGKR